MPQRELDDQAADDPANQEYEQADEPRARRPYGDGRDDERQDHRADHGRGAGGDQPELDVLSEWHRVLVRGLGARSSRARDDLGGHRVVVHEGSVERWEWTAQRFRLRVN